MGPAPFHGAFLMKKIITVVATFAALGGIYACSDNHTDGGDHHSIPTDEAGGHTSPYPTCQKIITECHMYDVGEGEVHDCHEVAHGASDDGACVAKKDDCSRICAAAGADAGADSAKADAEHPDGH